MLKLLTAVPAAVFLPLSALELAPSLYSKVCSLLFAEKHISSSTRSRYTNDDQNGPQEGN